MKDRLDEGLKIEREYMPKVRKVLTANGFKKIKKSPKDSETAKTNYIYGDLEAVLPADATKTVRYFEVKNTTWISMEQGLELWNPRLIDFYLFYLERYDKIYIYKRDRIYNAFKEKAVEEGMTTFYKQESLGKLSRGPGWRLYLKRDIGEPDYTFDM